MTSAEKHSGFAVPIAFAVILYALIAAIPAPPALPAGNAPAGKPERARIAMSPDLPHLDGDPLKATIVEVNYGPGEFSTAHSHPCPVIGYVLAGALRTQVKGEPEAVYKPGQTFYEAPNGIHQVSANASKTEPTKFLAFFVCDHEGPLSTDAPQSPSAGGQ
jgi:quercetin dioxygenase-like cupin family protein